MKTLKKFLTQVALSLLFLAGATLSIVLTKAIVTAYMKQVQSYSATASQLGAVASTPEGLIQLQSLLETINPLIQKTMILTYFILPLVLFLLFVGLIGTSFYLAKEKTKMKFSRYILIFAAVSVIPFSATMYLLLKILQLTGTVFLIGDQLGMFSLYILPLLVIGYATMIAYAQIGNYSLEKTLAVLKKSYILFPIFLLLTIVLVALFSTVLSTYLKINSGLELSVAYNFLALLIVLSATILFKNSLIKLMQSYAR
ncbi:MAG: hypothetical protein V1914_05020 [archaeon]